MVERARRFPTTITKLATHATKSRQLQLPETWQSRGEQQMQRGLQTTASPSQIRGCRRFRGGSAEASLHRSSIMVVSERAAPHWSGRLAYLFSTLLHACESRSYAGLFWNYQQLPVAVRPRLFPSSKKNSAAMTPDGGRWWRWRCWWRCRGK